MPGAAPGPGPCPFPPRFVLGGRRSLRVPAPVPPAPGWPPAASVPPSTATASNLAPPPANNPALDVPAQPGLLVHVVGAVENPGLYRLPRGDRVFDAIAAAGGFSPDADTARLPNPAGRLKDAQQVNAP